MIKVFTTNANPDSAGDVLTETISTWLKQNGRINIKQIHTNSNKYGWMIIIHYEIY